MFFFERRSAPSRYVSQLVVEFLDKRGKGKSINIARNGILTESPEKREVNEFIHFKLILPTHTSGIEVWGKVVRSTLYQGQHAVAIQFLHMFTDQREIWTDYVKVLQSPDKPLEKKVATSRVKLLSLMIQFKSVQNFEYFVQKYSFEGRFTYVSLQPLPIGQKCSVVLIHPIHLREFELDADIIQNTGKPQEGPGVAHTVHFTFLTDSIKAKLKSFVSGE